MTNRVLVCLHGWGGSSESFTELREACTHPNLSIIAPDLPGFGKEAEPDRPWTVDDFADYVEEFIEKNVHGPYALLGHSHGGRISLKLAQRWSTGKRTVPAPEHIFLCASAGIRHAKHARRILGLILSKSGNAVFSLPGLSRFSDRARTVLYKFFRVYDYKEASTIMKKTLIKVSGEDLKPLLHSITLPTTIFWGEDDTMTPLSDGKHIHTHIEGSTLFTYPHVRHRVHRDKATDIARIITNILIAS